MNTVTNIQTNQELRGINDVHSCAMLVDLRISQWTGRRKDKRVSRKVAMDNNVHESVGSYHKSLVDGSLLRPVQQITGAARAYHYQMTLPWFDAGARALSSAAYFEYKRNMNDYQEQFEVAVEHLLQSYPLAREEAKRMLGSLFDDSEYPTIDRLAEKFAFSIDLFPLPKGDDFRCALGVDEVSAIRRGIEEQTGSMMQRAVNDVYHRIEKVLESFVDRLGGEEKKIFRDTLVDNARELVNTLPALNITNDPEIDKLGKRMEKVLCRYDADVLRTNESAKIEVYNEAKTIKSDLDAFFGGVL